MLLYFHKIVLETRVQPFGQVSKYGSSDFSKIRMYCFSFTKPLNFFEIHPQKDTSWFEYLQTLEHSQIDQK